MFAKCTILHVEDDENDSLLFRQALTKAGFQGNYQRAPSADDAIRQLTDQPESKPDLIVTDSQLPTLSGHDFIRWLRETPTMAQVPIVVFSGTVNPALQQSVFERGASAFFAKSGNMENIVGALRYLHETRCGSREARA